MGLYKPKEEQTTYCEVTLSKENEIELMFSSDCGKYGTDEILQIFNYTPDELLDILIKIQDEE